MTKRACSDDYGSFIFIWFLYCYKYFCIYQIKWLLCRDHNFWDLNLLQLIGKL